MKRLFGLATAVALTIGVLTGCTPEEPRFIPGSSLVIGESALLENLNTSVASNRAVSLAGNDLRALTMPAFYSADINGTLVANTGFGEVTSLDLVTAKYELTGDSKWSDGVPVSTADLMLSWAAANNWGQAGFSSELVGTSLATAETLPSVSGKSITVTYASVTPDYQTALPISVAAHLIGQLAFADEGLVGEAAANRVVEAIQNNWQNDLAKIATAYNSGLAALEGQAWDSSLVVTSGAYEIVSASSQTVVLKARQDYLSGQPPTVDELTINFYADANELTAALVAGKVDLARPIASATSNLNQMLGTLQSVSELSVTSGFGGEAQFAILNRGELSEFALKPDGSNQALVDAKTLATQLFLPRSAIIDALALIDPIEQADSFVFPSTSKDYADAIESNGTADFRFQQAEQAAELLVEAGFARRINVRVLFDSTSANGQLEFGLLARYAKVAGINLQNVSSARPAEVLRSGEWELYLTDRMSMSQDASSLALATGSVTGFTDPDVKTLASKFAGGEASAAELKQLDKLLVSKRFGLPIIQLPNLLVHTAKLRSYQPDLATQQVVWGYWNWLVDAPAK